MRLVVRSRFWLLAARVRGGSVRETDGPPVVGKSLASAGLGLMALADLYCKVAKSGKPRCRP